MRAWVESMEGNEWKKCRFAHLIRLIFTQWNFTGPQFTTCKIGCVLPKSDWCQPKEGQANKGGRSSKQTGKVLAFPVRFDSKTNICTYLLNENHRTYCQFHRPYWPTPSNPRISCGIPTLLWSWMEGKHIINWFLHVILLTSSTWQLWQRLSCILMGGWGMTTYTFSMEFAV